MKRRAFVFCGSCFAAAGAAAALRPRHRAAEYLIPITLDAQIGERIGGWSVDKGQMPVLPNPEVQAKLDKIYTQVLARTYVDPRGRRVMLSIAYGSDQGSDATAAHRPEFCYVAQGFAVRTLGNEDIDISGRHVRVRRLVGSFGSRVEPITYWVTLNDTAVLPGIERKIEQIRLGLSGQIPDGMLVRVSTIGEDLSEGFSLQSEFLAALASGMSPAVRDRYFGKSAA